MVEPGKYAQSGVDIDAGQRAVAMMADAVRTTYTPQVLSDTGNFGGIFDISALQDQFDAPALVASTDGVGTKTMVAAALNRWDTIGQDLVNHCINDILVQGAQPLFFLDYVASSQLQPEQIAEVVKGIAYACKTAGVALIGGETAEMPGVYQQGEIDLVGTIVGIADRSEIEALDGHRIEAGDLVLGIPSSGLHTNGYTLARAVLADMDWQKPHHLLNSSIGEALLAVHRPYLAEIRALRAQVDVRALAHITGGGIVDNLPRVLPEDRLAIIDLNAWEPPPIFDLIQRAGDVEADEMRRVFNMGLGMLVVLPADAAEQAQQILPEACIVGRIEAGERGVELRS